MSSGIFPRTHQGTQPHLWAHSIKTRAALAISILFMMSCHARADLTPLQQQSNIQGLVLYNQYKIATPELAIAAEAGDREAQFYLAEELRQQKQYITADAQKWYEAAAAQGDYYSMFKLATSKSDLCGTMNNCTKGTKNPGEWLEHLWKIAEPKANSGDGDGEAMYIMYLATTKLDWLEKSAIAGYAQGQWLLANRYKEGESFFLPWKRQEVIGQWLKASAEGGFPKAMLEFSAYLYENGGDLSIARHWIEEAAKSGYETGVSSYGAYLAHAPSLYDFPLDLVKGYALTSLLTELDGGGNIKPYVDEVLPEIAAKMSPGQIDEAKIFAKKWKDSHPPLSFYPDKLGY